MKYYIGLDAHSTTSTFAVVDENGQCVLRETVKTSEQSLVHVISKIQGALRKRPSNTFQDFICHQVFLECFLLGHEIETSSRRHSCFEAQNGSKVCHQLLAVQKILMQTRH